MKQKLMKSILGLLVFTFVLIGCSSNEDALTTKKTVYSQEQVKLVGALRKTALDVCLMTAEKNVFQEIKSVVNSNLQYGQDENARFKDLIDNGQSVFYLGSQSQKAPTVNRFFSKIYHSNTNDSTGTYLIDNNIQIYWPYSENWDGKEIPVITYAPLNKDITNVMAYKLNQDGTIDSLLVDEEYAKNNPVWVINQNEINYDDLPNFARGENKKNNILYLQESIKQLPMQKVDNPPLNDSTYVYSIYIGTMKATRQWDTWLAGGSEFRFRMVGSKTIPTGIASDFSSSVVTAPAFSRKEIGNGTEKKLNSLINIDWGVRESMNGFALWEEDGGSSTQAVKFDVGYDKIKLSASFNIGNVDDLIYQIGLDRNAFFTINQIDNNNGLVDDFAYNTSGGVYWTMPWIITKRAY